MTSIEILNECIDKIKQIRKQNKEKMVNHEKSVLKSKGKVFDEDKHYFGIEQGNHSSRIYFIRKYGNKKLSFFDEFYSDKGLKYGKIIYSK